MAKCRLFKQKNKKEMMYQNYKADAETLTATWEMLSKSVKKEQAKCMLVNGVDLVLHEVNKLVVMKMNFTFAVINKESLKT